MRYLLLAVCTLIAGYVAGVVFGYRAAVTDYVENDAAKIEKVAATMYDSVDPEDLPEEIQEALDVADENDAKGFQ